jgi:SAM-dependent MidA family methyltransferase
LSATDLHRWYLNQQREEKEKEREKYNQHQLQAAVDHQSIMKRGHNLGGGSIVALQSATVKYRQLRQRKQQRQHQISETKTTASFLQSTSVMERAAAATVIN